MPAHKIVKCKKCKTIIAQCRCMDCNKIVEYKLCDICEKSENEKPEYIYVN